VKTLAWFATLGCLASVGYSAELNPRAILTKSISNYEKDWNAALDFTCTEHDVTDTPGHSATAEVSQVSILDGTPYGRLIARNGHPLTAEEVRKEDEKYRKAAGARDKETAEQRARRLRKYQEQWRFLGEIPDAFDMQLLGHETIQGRANYVIQLTPKAGYVAKSKNARMFPDIEGKLWVDEQDLRWTQAEAHVINTISIGWVLARIGAGAHITIKLVKVDDEHWMLKELAVNGSARIMLLKNRSIDEIISYSDYKRVIPRVGTAAAKNR
jgi:hypothetical protein